MQDLLLASELTPAESEPEHWPTIDGGSVSIWHPRVISAPFPEDLRELSPALAAMGLHKRRITNIKLGEENEAFDDDLDGIMTWLQTKRANSERTYVAYRREVERLLRWSIAHCNKPITGLKIVDFQAFAEFLRDPEPRELWVATDVRAPRGDPMWRPFNARKDTEGEFIFGLDKASWLRCLSACQAMLRFWQDVHYVADNKIEVSGLTKKAHLFTIAKRREQVNERRLFKSDWAWVTAWVESWPRETRRQRFKYRRARFLLQTLRMTGLRLHEIAALNMGDFRQYEVQGELFWNVIIHHGKGDKTRPVDIPDELIDELAAWRQFRELTPSLPEHNDKAPALCTQNLKDRWAENSIYKELKEIFAGAADAMLANDVSGHERVRSASTHWLRHTYATEGANSPNIDLRDVQASLGHSKIETTTIYVHTERADRNKRLQETGTEFGDAQIQDMIAQATGG